MELEKGQTPSAGTLLLGEDGRYSIASPIPEGIEDVYQTLTTLASVDELVPASLISRMTGRDVFEVQAALGLLELSGKARAFLCPSCPRCSAAGAGWAVGVAVPLDEGQTCVECGHSYSLTHRRLIFLYRPL